MDYNDRKTNTIWTSPTGKEFILKIEEGGHKRKHSGEVKNNPSNNKKNTKKTINDTNDTFSDMGVTGKDVSLNCIFIGDNHDIEAQEFEDALCEVGKSRLKLPYGKEFTVNVIDYELKYSLKDKINSTIISVNFHQTSNTTFPTKESSSAVKKQADITNTAIAQMIADMVAVETSQKVLNDMNTTFSNVLSKISDKLDDFNNLSVNSIMSDILGQSFTDNSFTIMSQVQQVLYKSATAVNKVKDLSKSTHQSSFASVIRSFNSLVDDIETIFHSGKSPHNFYIADSMISSCITGISRAATNYEFDTRKDAVNVAVALIDLDTKRNKFISQESDIVTDLSDKIVADTGVSELVCSAAASIIEKSFSLKIEKIIELSQDESTVDLAYRYYKDEFDNFEDAVEYLITTNEFDDEEFYLAKRGTKLKIYV